MVTKVKQLSKGRRLTLLWAARAYTAEYETSILTELPKGWKVVNNKTAYEALS